MSFWADFEFFDAVSGVSARQMAWVSIYSLFLTWGERMGCENVAKWLLPAVYCLFR